MIKKHLTTPPPCRLPTLWRGGEKRYLGDKKSPLHAMGRGFRGGAKHLFYLRTTIMPSDALDAIYRVPTRNRDKIFIPLIILLIGWLFIIHAGTANKRFHPDEALYTTFARNAFVHGDWLLTSPLDKPPISIYANAISQALFGGVVTDAGVYDLPIRAGEFVARIPNIFAGIITVALFIALEKQLSPKRASIGAIALIASPLFISLSVSAFTDSLMLMWVMGAWLCIERRQSFLSGFLLMVGFATKPQALFLLPLLVMRGLWGKSSRDWVSFVAGMTIPLVVLLLWDISRGTTSIFALGQYNYPTQALIHAPNDWFGRLWLWAEYLFWGINPIIVLLGIAMMIQEIKKIRLRDNITLHVLFFIIGYSLIHIVLGIPLYDRYILLIIPVIAIALRQYVGIWLLFGVLIMLVDIPIGRDGDPLDSEATIIALADEINALPFGAIVYDHWRGWELGYYLGAWSDKRRVYYPDPITQAEDSLNNPEKWTRYLVAPIDVDYDIWLSAMQDAGYETSAYKQLVGYIIFALDPPR